MTLTETPEAAYERGLADGRAAAVSRIHRLIVRQELYGSSARYVRGIKAAELVAENLDLAGRSLPDDYQHLSDVAEDDELHRMADGKEE